MSEPKFRVGEEVIVCSDRFPNWNGDDVVVQVVTDRMTKNTTTGEIHNPGPRYITKRLIDSGFADYLWMESSLRKKHKPGDSFESIMNECKTGVTA